MHQEQIERLRERADAILFFLDMEPEAQDRLWPLIPRGIRSTIELLDAISQQPKTYKELAAELGNHPMTISQKLNLLSEFIPIELGDDTAYAPSPKGGRRRRIAVKEE
jgi:hypothetical protein